MPYWVGPRPMTTKLDAILGDYEIYVLTESENLPHFKIVPFGKKARPIEVTDPQNGVFVDLLNQLDGLSYGNKDLAMPKWVGLDCAALPSAIVGLAKNLGECPSDLTKKFDIATGYTSLIPISEYCAIPSPGGVWIGHTCASLIKGAGLGLLTKLLALKVYQAHHLKGVAQYENDSVRLHTRIAALRLVSAITPAHNDQWNTFIYHHPVDQEGIESIFGSSQEMQDPTLLLDPTDLEQKIALQQHIKQGKEVSIVYPGHIFDEHHKLFVPVVIA